jgi:MFS family permease
MKDASLSRKSQMFLLSLLTGIFFFNMLLRVILAPLMPVIEGELGLSHTASGSLFMMIAVGVAAGLFGSGFVSARLTHRRTIAIAAIAGGCAFFFIAASHSLWSIRFGLIFLGIATGLYLPSGMTTITAAIPPIHWGKAFAFHEFAPTFSFILAPLIVEGLLLLCRWQGILILIGALSLILGLVSVWPPAETSRERRPRSTTSACWSRSPPSGSWSSSSRWPSAPRSASTA